MRNTITWLISVLFLMGMALYNGYPLVTSDTGTYINSAFTMEVARDRPFGYSILLALASLEFSLWLPVLVQSILLLHLINRMTSHLLGREMMQHWTRLGVVGFLAIFTGVGWYSGMIMPDIFTSIGVLAFLLCIFEKDIWRLLLYGGILVYAISTHISHLLIFPLLVVTLFISGRKKKWLATGKYALLGICALSGWILIPTIHWAVDGHFTVNKSSHVFLTGRFLETGTLQKYLHQECDTHPIRLCDYQYELPENAIAMIWSPDSPLYQTNGWEDPDGEYRQMVHEILVKPGYSLHFLYTSLFHSLTQLLQTQVGDGLQAHVAETNPFWKVQQYFPSELPTYLNSLQNTSRLSFEEINSLYRWTVLASVLFLLWLLLNQARMLSRNDKIAILVCIGAVVINAFVTATFGNVLARLQSRIIWLIPMIAVLMIIKYRSTISQSIRNLTR